MTELSFLVCFVAGAMVVTNSFHRFVQHRLDNPRLATHNAAERERSRVVLASLERADTLLDEFASRAGGGGAGHAAQSGEDVYAQVEETLARGQAEADLAADRAVEALPGLERASSFALVADGVLVVAGIALMIGSAVGLVMSLL